MSGIWSLVWQKSGFAEVHRNPMGEHGDALVNTKAAFSSPLLLFLLVVLSVSTQRKLELTGVEVLVH